MDASDYSARDAFKVRFIHVSELNIAGGVSVEVARFLRFDGPISETPLCSTLPLLRAVRASLPRFL